MAGLVELWKTEHAPLGGPDYWQTMLPALSKMWWTPLDYTAADFQKITAATLILLGDRDSLIPVEQAVDMYRLIPNTELAIFPKTDHGETVHNASGPNPFFVSTVLDFLLRQSTQDAESA